VTALFIFTRNFMADATTPTSTTINYDDFAKIELRVATVLEATPIPKSEKMLALQVDLGTEKREILAGIKQHVTPEEIVGKQIIVVANLAPRPMFGRVSNGMLLAATDPVTGKVIVITPSQPVAPGAGVR
jgi:methionyl-tRNA synthetase